MRFHFCKMCVYKETKGTGSLVQDFMVRQLWLVSDFHFAKPMSLGDMKG